MTTYNWQQSDWPHFKYDLTTLYEVLLAISEKTGAISGKINHLSKNLQTEALINLMVEEAIKTSKIEGEHLQDADVRSSIKNKLGLNPTSVSVPDKRAQGIAELMLNARKTFKQPLTEKKLFNWHLLLMSGSLNPNLTVGYWRTDTEPMQIVSGHYGKWQVHYEAPPAKKVPEEMHQFLHWFNQTAPKKPLEIKFGPVRAAIAHLYFESIHPFDDGNGRIGRIIAEKALSQSAGHPVLLSLSHAIEANKKTYYQALKKASQSNEITAWIEYFLQVILKAEIAVESQINFILKKSLFFHTYENILNERQMKVVQRMMKEGAKGFEGGINAKKYMTIAGVSKATATRDLQHMAEIGALKPLGKGRSVRYELNVGK